MTNHSYVVYIFNTSSSPRVIAEYYFFVNVLEVSSFLVNVRVDYIDLYIFLSRYHLKHMC